MSMFRIFDVSGSAVSAQSQRLNVVASNLANADTVAGALHADIAADCVVIGCDSMLLIDGELQGKPDGAEQARQRWAKMAGREGVLLTGHAVRRVTSGLPTAGDVGTRSTTVRMGVPTPAELSAYISTGEPLAVAGALTIDGYGGWFVDSVDGDPSKVEVNPAKVEVDSPTADFDPLLLSMDERGSTPSLAEPSSGGGR